MKTQRYQDIDWNGIWKESRRQKSWRRKKSKDWDKRAAAFARRNIASSYVEQFIDRIHLEPDWTVLDIGAGPGTLAIPLARRVKAVTAIDFSASMLDALQEYAGRAGVTNIRTVEASWEDNWERLGVGPHDVAIASRSLSVDDLRAALEKLDAFATRRVIISDRVGSGPFDPDIFAAVGREFSPGPDYILTLNLLYQMGIHARVDFIILDENKVYESREQAVDSCAWMLDNLTAEEEQKLQAYLAAHLVKRPDHTWEVVRRRPVKWALIWWDSSGR